MLLCLHGTQPEYSIGVLIDKSLIKIEGDRVLMHDLIEDMGKEIVQQESPDDPGARTRLWFYRDIFGVLEQNTGTGKVEVIVLDLPKHLRERNEVQIQWSGKAFMKMKNLKMLVIKNASFSKRPAHLPNSLKLLKWKGYPFKLLPYCPTELIYLDLSCGNFDALQPFTKTFHNLSCMNLKNCNYLQQIPDLSRVSNLRELWLDGCTNLVEIHHSVGCLNKLQKLSAMRCNKLEILPPDLRLTSLEHLNLFGCSSLQSFPQILVEMKDMRTLDLDRTAIISLPSSICSLTGLEILNMQECPYLEQLPTTICQLPNLWAINANFSEVMTHFKMCDGGEEANLDCHALPLKLEHFCFSNCNLSDDSLALCLSYFTNMIRLDISFNDFTTLPACIQECHHLRYLLIDHCERLQHIVEMPPNLEKFSAVYCMSLTESSKSIVSGNFPENLDMYCRGSCVSFWVRDLFPTIFLWIIVKDDQDFLSNCTFLVHVNNTKLDISSEWLLLSTIKMGHLCICDLQSIIQNNKVELPHGYNWKHVKVSIKSNTTQEINSGRDQFHFALHVYKQQNNSETIRFEDPRTTYVDSNSWQRVQQQPQDWKELEGDMRYHGLDPTVVRVKAHLSPEEEEDLKAKRAVLPSGWTYDVFLSYRGDYECSNFVNHLYNSLCKRRIRAFVDDELVKTSEGELRAMQESRTAIIVISKNYASSTSCLNSLATILECFRAEYRFICPLFYGMEPFELQHQTGSYREVLARLEQRFIHSKQQQQKWRLALSEAAKSRSYCYLNSSKNATAGQYIIEMIISEVSATIDRFPFPFVPKDSVGLDESRVQEVMSLVDVGSNEEVKIVGICGEGASTIARAVCNYAARHFEDLWYFVDFFEIARGAHITLDDFHNTIRQPRFPQKKILLTLDNFDRWGQSMKALRECDRFGQGSRIIVVTCDKQLFANIERICGSIVIFDLDAESQNTET